ncbi:hypothetical protein GCM10010123_16660 [Pilimelia anulata]|uniref:Calcineurin-like phosphoesterase domain-containing protein n=1 Tax=Pilimelia anulata TaxID=53371 RepID=A0A8J3B6C4_9ACTN|nr:hypothetical protein GCM10010123_16660 [Pilimelia anulata]
MIFFGVILAVVGGIHGYLWRRLVADTTARGGWPRRAGTALVVALALLVPVVLVGTRQGAGWLAPGYVWIALMFYLLVVLLALELPLAAALWRRRARGPAPATPATGEQPAGPTPGEPTPGEPEPAPGEPAEPAPDPAAPPGRAEPDGADHDAARRLLLRRGAAIFAGLTATGITGYGIRTALGPPQLDRVDIPLAKLPRGMDGFRIAVVSDIHLGPINGRAHTERIVAAINRLGADAVAIVGDLVDGTVEELGAAAAPLRDLRSRYGSFFVTGNHEFYSGVAPWLVELPRLGVRVLANERVPIEGLDLAGVHDVAGGEPQGFGPVGDGLAPDFARTFADRDPARPSILLAHQPVQAHEAAKYAVDLQLSGHTHGGQMVPFNYLVGLEQPVVSGLGEVDGTRVYVTNGAGFWGPPVRVGAPPQVSLVRLRADR